MDGWTDGWVGGLAFRPLLVDAPGAGLPAPSVGRLRCHFADYCFSPDVLIGLLSLTLANRRAVRLLGSLRDVGGALTQDLLPAQEAVLFLI